MGSIPKLSAILNLFRQRHAAVEPVEVGKVVYYIVCLIEPALEKQDLIVQTDVQADQIPS